MAERLLILGGTGEAAALAEAVAERYPNLATVTSLAGVTRHPRPVPGDVRTGGFGGADGLADYLCSAHISHVVDATHPFAARITDNAEAACRLSGTPRLLVERPPWQGVAGDNWIRVADAEAAAEALAGLAERVFLSVGRQEIEAFSALPHIWFLVRMIDAPRGALPLHRYEVVLGRGPFDEDGERALFLLHGIQAVVTKNSGGEATYAKITVARERGLPVVMIERPPHRAGETAASVAEALAWINARL